MAHKTRVAGTNYEISGGKTLVGGTGYGITKGRTLVGGTGYDISFGAYVSVSITKNTGYSFAAAIIGGVIYTDAASGIDVKVGDVIRLRAKNINYGAIKIDGVTVSVIKENEYRYYDWRVPEEITMVTIKLRNEIASGYETGYVEVTTS